MDRTPIKEALQKAQLIIAAHGMVSYMPNYVKSSLSNPVGDQTDRLNYEFYIDPNKPGYSAGNYNCALSVHYSSLQEEERDGGIYRDYKACVMIRVGSADLYLSQLARRENMISSLAMLASIVEASIPKNITLTVMSPEVLKEKKQQAHEQKISEQIYNIIGKESIKNLRTGGRSKCTRISEKYSEVYGSMPDVGRYRFSQIRAVDRRGRAKVQACFVFIVDKMRDDSYSLKAYRTS